VKGRGGKDMTIKREASRKGGEGRSTGREKEGEAKEGEGGM